MKLYAKIQASRGGREAVKGDDNHLRIEITAKNKQVLVLLIDYLPKEASKDNQECVILQMWGGNKELSDRKIITLLQGKTQKGESSM